MSRHDAVVVGAGLAGMVVAVRLAEEGADVLVVARGAGATHLSPVTIDVLGYAPEPVDEPLAGVEALVAQRPDHPYRLVGAQGLRDAVGWFASRFADGPLAPYAYTGTLEHNVLLPTAVGVLKPSAVVPETLLGGDLRGGGAVCVVGFRALKDFYAMLLADNLRRQPGVTARGIELDLAPEDRADVSALGFARAFDQAPFRRRVVAQLAPRLRGDERIAFPAVLGVADPHGVWAELEERLGHPVFEIPTLPPSVPGLRVHATLRERLHRAGGRLLLNQVVTAPDHAGGRLTGVRARVGLRDVVHGAGWVVLATGGFASGGLRFDSRWRAHETALGLPVVGVPPPGEERFRPGYFDDQPMARAGVAVDGQQRPLAPDGAPAFRNVLVAGATLAGAEPWREKSGDGLSLATGHRAAGLILEAAAAHAAAVPATTGGVSR